MATAVRLEPLMRASETSEEGREKVKAVISCRGCQERRSPAPSGARGDEAPALGDWPRSVSPFINAVSTWLFPHWSFHVALQPPPGGCRVLVPGPLPLKSGGLDSSPSSDTYPGVSWGRSASLPGPCSLIGDSWVKRGVLCGVVMSRRGDSVYRE